MIRGLVRDPGGLTRPITPGDLSLNNAGGVNVIATDADLTLTVAQLMKKGGYVQFSSFSAGRTITTDTAANIIAAMFPGGNIGDSVHVTVSGKAAFAGTWAAGVGVTLAGRATTPASATTGVIITMLTATTVEWFVL